MLQVPSEKALLEESARLQHRGVRHELFYEDDVQGYTAIATESVERGRRRIFREHKLLGAA